MHLSSEQRHNSSKTLTPQRHIGANINPFDDLIFSSELEVWVCVYVCVIWNNHLRKGIDVSLALTKTCHTLSTGLCVVCSTLFLHWSKRFTGGLF